MSKMITDSCGRTLSLREWERNSMNYWRHSYNTLRMRLDKGFTIEQALYLPPYMARRFRHSDEDVRRIGRNPALTRSQLAQIAGRSPKEVRLIMRDE
jgi:hypothetical protein